MKKIALLVAFACLAAALPGRAAEKTEWLTDLPKALGKAKAENKLVLMDFTGSDWCPPCKELKKTVLSAPDFEAYAAKNVVLVEVDFPNAKPQTEELKKANKALSEKYAVEGFPTLIVLDGDGRQLKKTVGYEGTTSKELIATLEKLKQKNQ